MLNTSPPLLFKWIPQSSLICTLLQHAITKTTLPWQSPMFLYLFILISYPCWSSGPFHSLLTVTMVVTCALPHQFLPSISKQSIPHASSLEQHWQLRCSTSDPVGRKQGEGLWDSVYKVSSSGRSCSRPSHSLATHSLAQPEKLPVLQAPFIINALYRCAI